MKAPTKENWLDQKFDVIVVGAGIGGLTCASWLALAGKKILVLEKNGFIGGRCASYNKQGFTVDYGIHGFSQGKRGPLQEVVRAAVLKLKLSTDLLSWYKNPIALKFKESILTPRLPISVSHFWNVLPTLWRVLRMKGVKWNDKIALLRTTVGLLMVRARDPKPLELITVKEMLEKLSNSQFAQQIVASSSDCVSLIPYSEFAARDYMDILFGILKSGGIWYPKGGCGAISNSYKQIIEKCGGIIQTSQCVEEIIVTGGNIPTEPPKVLGVRLKIDQRELYAPCVVTNIHLKELFNKMLKRKYFPADLAQKVDSLETALSAIVVHIALDTKIFQEKVVMESPMLIPQNNQESNEENLIGGFFVFTSNLDPDVAPPGKQLIIAGFGINRTVVYDKDHYKDILLDKLQRLAPPAVQIRDHIDWIEVFGPEDFASLFGEEGAVVGIASNVKQTREHRPDSRTPIIGLYHCGDDSGQNLWGVGTELAASSGNQCARIILEENNI